MERFFYFKVTFLSISAGLFAGMLVNGFFDLDFSNNKAIAKLFLRSFLTAIVVGLVLGLLNMYFKIGKAPKK